MTIVEAINRNVELKGELLREGRVEKALAVLLGIEALKALGDCRERDCPLSHELLPGETKE